MQLRVTFVVVMEASCLQVFNVGWVQFVRSNGSTEQERELKISTEKENIRLI